MGKFIIIFGVLLLLNIMMMTISYIYMRQVHDNLFCSISDFLSSAAQFLDSNGANNFGSILPVRCRNDTISLQILQLEKVIHNRIKECNQQKEFSLSHEFEESRPLLTLFTSWEPSILKYFVHNCTLRNWSSFVPQVNLVLFTNNSALHKEAMQYGWNVFPVDHHVEGVPVLKHMFMKVISSFNSTFYGYSNSDILFIDNLIQSLRVVKKTYRGENLFLTGRRTNVPDLTVEDVVSYDNIRKAATSRGKLFIISSEDYFITTSEFHWNNVPAFIIGRPAYDNWLVSHARCRYYTVIDLSDTVLACHQTTQAGNKEGFKHKTLTTYNHELFTSLGVGTQYEAGYSICARLKTYHSLCGNIEVTERSITQIPTYCSCKT